MGISYYLLYAYACFVYIKICEENKKQKDKKNALNMIASMFSRRCRNYRMYLEGDSPIK